jgi:hypothetical protein
LQNSRATSCDVFELRKEFVEYLSYWSHFPSLAHRQAGSREA